MSRWFGREIQTAAEAAIKSGVTGLDRERTQLQITYVDDPQPDGAWAFPVYRNETETLEILISPREKGKK